MLRSSLIKTEDTRKSSLIETEGTRNSSLPWWEGVRGRGRLVSLNSLKALEGDHPPDASPPRSLA